MSVVESDEQVRIAEEPSHLCKQPFRFWFALIAVVGVGLLMRVLMHVGRDWQGDEWGTILALDVGYRDLLTHFGGWRTMNFYLAGLKVISQVTGTRNWLLVAPGIVFGGWTILLSAAIALRLSGRRAALVAALLVATNPFLITYSVTIRSYIYLVAFSLLMLLYLIDWQRRPGAGRALGLAVAGALALLAHMNAVDVVAAVGVVLLFWLVGKQGTERRGLWRPVLHLAVFCLLAMGLAVAAYVPQWNDIATFRAQWSDTAPTSLFFVSEVVRRFFGEGWFVWPILAAIAYGGWRAIRERAESGVLLAMIAIPVVLICAAGVSHYPHAYARFLMPVLPMLLVLAADGLAAAKGRAGRMASVLLLAAIVLASGWELDSQYRILHDKPWVEVARDLKADRRDGDVVMMLGRGVYGEAMIVHGVLPTVNPVAALQAAVADRPVRLFIVDVDSLLPGKLVVERWGTLQLGCIEGTPVEVSGRLRKALEECTGGRVDAKYATAYQELGRLCRQQGDELAAEHCLRLRAECMLRDKRARNTPPQMLR
jgi:hypothetical protein